MVPKGPNIPGGYFEQYSFPLQFFSGNNRIFDRIPGIYSIFKHWFQTVLNGPKQHFDGVEDLWEVIQRISTNLENAESFV